MAKETRKPHFDVSAALIRQLGEELVSDEVTAMMELIKNSYDADADWARVEINTKDDYSNPNIFYKDSPPGFISITDNGFGMSDDDIWNSWMKISLSSKKKFKADGLVTPKGRTPLGEKGVGRLSTNKLGSRLELFTGKAKSDKKNHVAFDWETFDDDTSLTSVPVHIDQLKKDPSEKGTTLVVTNLKEAQKWEGVSWDKFRGQISQMIFPFKEDRIFNVYLKINGENIDLDELSEKVRKNSVTTLKFELTDNNVIINGTVKFQKLNGSNSADATEFYETKILPDFGEDFFTFLTDPVDNKQNHVDDLKYSGKKGVFYTFKREIEFNTLDRLSLNIDDTNSVAEIAHPGNFKGEIDDFFFKDTDSITQAFSSIAEFKRIVQNQVGVRIFRDGFGIKPYGIDGQDWLNLSGGQTSGGSFYGLRPGNVVGFVSITAKENRNLKEKTDREGFTDTPYSRNFMRVMNYVIDQANNILEGTRRSYNEYRKQKAQQSAGIKSMSDSFDKLNKASSKAKKITKKTQEVKYHLANAAIKVREASKKQGSSKGTAEDEERRQLFAEISSLLEEAQELLEQVEDILTETNKLDEYVKYLQPQIESLEEQLSDFAELAGLGLTAEALSHELSNIVDRIVEETERLNKKIRGKTAIDISSINVYVEYIRSATKSFRKQLSHLAPSLKYVRESKEKISVKGFLAELKEYYEERFDGEIGFVTSIKGSDFTLKINKGKLTQIFDNIIINSEYWLKEKLKQHPRFKPVVTVEAKEPFIKIYDNGNGIEPAIQDRIFQPFVSGKPKKIGRGLGLFIVQQLIETTNCEIILSSEKNQYGKRYIFQIDLSSIIEL
ncbi:MAG: ATP-binding protein [Chitinophagaceae bacterium]|nr:ATP-binding protein [Chitinophagaceae bacterium]